MLRAFRERFRRLAADRMGKQAESARHEVGEIVIDATGEYFPREVKARRRRAAARGFAAGLGVGVVLGYALRR